MPDRKCVPCKIGTVPRLVAVDRRGKIEVGRRIRIRYCDGIKFNRFSPIEMVRVTKINSDGYFFADR